MSARIRAHMRSNVVGYIAIFLFAVGGSATALSGRGRIDHNDLRPHVVHTGKIHKGAVTEPKLAASARQAFLGSTVTVRESATTSVDNGGIAGPSANCDTGEVAVGGGVRWSVAPTANSTAMLESGPSVQKGSLSPTAWTVTVGNTSGESKDFRVLAVCVKVG